MEIRKVFVFRNLNTSTYFPDSNKGGVPCVERFDKNFEQHLIVIVFRGT